MHGSSENRLVHTHISLCRAGNRPSKNRGFAPVTQGQWQTQRTQVADLRALRLQAQTAEGLGKGVQEGLK